MAWVGFTREAESPCLRSLVPSNTNPTLKPRHFLLPCRLLLPYTFFFHTKTKINRIRADFCCRLNFFSSTLKPRLVEHTADVYCRTDGTDFFWGMYQLETRFARIIVGLLGNERLTVEKTSICNTAVRDRCQESLISGQAGILM